jgi:hypothetical protein
MSEGARSVAILPRYDAGEFGVLLLQESGKSLEVVEGVLGPLDGY